MSTTATLLFGQQLSTHDVTNTDEGIRFEIDNRLDGHPVSVYAYTDPCSDFTPYVNVGVHVTSTYVRYGEGAAYSAIKLRQIEAARRKFMQWRQQNPDFFATLCAAFPGMTLEDEPGLIFNMDTFEQAAAEIIRGTTGTLKIQGEVWWLSMGGIPGDQRARINDALFQLSTDPSDRDDRYTLQSLLSKELRAHIFNLFQDDEREFPVLCGEPVSVLLEGVHSDHIAQTGRYLHATHKAAPTSGSTLHYVMAEHYGC
ncbi:MAG: hypothetical protein AAFV53_35375 [Myxococcota bacterium]